MKKYKLNSSTLLLALLVAVAIGFTSCKSQKKLASKSDVKAVKAEIEDEQQQSMEDAPREIAEPVVKAKAVASTEQRLTNYFGAIASAPTTAAANASIQEALGMFSSSEAPLLIIIYKAGSQPDYDEPTTIGKYLDYLKDTKNNKAQIEELVYDTNGKIKEVVLKK
jgi:hypothetical protein